MRAWRWFWYGLRDWLDWWKGSRRCTYCDREIPEGAPVRCAWTADHAPIYICRRCMPKDRPWGSP